MLGTVMNAGEIWVNKMDKVVGVVVFILVNKQ